jgi:hypothetical protein
MEGKVLGFFARHPGATQRDLAQHSGRDKAQLARLIKSAVATLSIIRWREDPIGFTGWDANASRNKRRLKRAIDAPPGLLQDHLRRIQDRQLLTIERVREDAVAGIRQILETQGAEVFIGDHSSRKLTCQADS